MCFLGYPFNCDECMNYRCDQCNQLDVCDWYHQHNFKPGIIYQLQVQPPVMSLNRTNNNLLMQPV